VKFAFAKGHGAHNDFVVIPDPDDQLDLTPAGIAHICDRRTGIGADGLLRAVRHASLWFMDYYNADGSPGAMCGNGIRVFARYLTDTGLCPPGTLTIGTRAGTRKVHVPDHTGTITVGMGHSHLPGTPDVLVSTAGHHWPAVHVDMGNPHAVAFVDDLTHAGLLHHPPSVTPHHAYPEGVTVEFAVRTGPRRLSLRIHERGVGETQACGTGACAAVAALLRIDQHTGPGAYTVDVPGGRLEVTVHQDGAMALEGPAVLVAHGAMELPVLDATPVE